MALFVLQRRVRHLVYVMYVFGLIIEGVCFIVPVDHHEQNNRSPKSIKTILSDGIYNNSPYSEQQIDIEHIILSLSSVADDKSRREQLSQIFEENVQSDDGGESFMKLFDAAMVVVGDRIRMDAAAKAGDNSDIPSIPLLSQGKPQMEGQLWACIDMMVQSKTLMKQARMK